MFVPFLMIVFGFCLLLWFTLLLQLRLYTVVVHNVHWFMPEDWTLVDRVSSSFLTAGTVPYQKLFPSIPCKEETNEPNQWYPWENRVYTVGWRTGWRCLLTGAEDQFAVRMCWQTCAMTLSFWHSWPGIAGDFCTTAKPRGILGDWWPIPVLILPTRPFLLPLVADRKNSLQGGAGWWDDLISFD